MTMEITQTQKVANIEASHLKVAFVSVCMYARMREINDRYTDRQLDILLQIFLIIGYIKY